jgi:purine-nucleoside phosphorylase
MGFHSLECVSYLRSRLPDLKPSVGLILGSGLGALADEIRDPIVIPYQEIPGFPPSHVPGHAGNIIFGKLGNQDVVALAGRAHLYEGWTVEQATLPTRCLHGLGATTLIVSNASGGVNPRFRSGQVVAIDQHIDWLFRGTPTESNGSLGLMGNLNRNRHPYDRELIASSEAIAIRLGFTLARGTYLATLGPNYETRSEYRMFAKFGADMVGMSTVPEVIVANQLGMRVLAFSIVTNVATPDAPNKTDHAEVLDWSRQAQSQLIPLIRELCYTQALL